MPVALTTGRSSVLSIPIQMATGRVCNAKPIHQAQPVLPNASPLSVRRTNSSQPTEAVGRAPWASAAMHWAPPPPAPQTRILRTASASCAIQTPYRPRALGRRACASAIPGMSKPPTESAARVNRGPFGTRLDVYSATRDTTALAGYTGTCALWTPIHPEARPCAWTAGRFRAVRDPCAPTCPTAPATQDTLTHKESVHDAPRAR
jgi:hypothetical protein